MNEILAPEIGRTEQPPLHPLKTLHTAGCKLIPVLPGTKRPAISDWGNYLAGSEDIDHWIAGSLPVGILAATHPILDIDITDARINAATRSAVASLVPAPVFRVGRSPKAAVICETVVPFKKIIIELIGANGLAIRNDDGKPARVEVLADGQQAVIYGQHPDTRQPYSYESGDAKGGIELLAERASSSGFPSISPEWVSKRFVSALSEELSPQGIVVRILGSRADIAAPAANQEDLRAPSIEVLRECVALIPNGEDFDDRTRYIGVLTAIKAASGAKTEEALQIALEWTARWVRGNDPSVVESDFRSLTPPYRVGFTYLAALAAPQGFNAAAYDFTVSSSAPAAVEAFYAQYALVRTVAGAVLYLPKSGPPEFIRTPHWRDLTRNEFTTNGEGKRVRVSDQWMGSPKRQTYARVVFDPASPARSGVPSPHGGEDFNLYPGLALAPSNDGSCDLFLAHLRDVVADGDEASYQWVLMWLADIVQHPDKLPGTALVLRGAQGAGKSVVGEVFERILGPLHVSLSDPNQLVGQFNSSHEGRLMIQVEEAFFAGNRGNIGRIKNMITAPKVRIERKGIEAYEVGNFARLLITSNEDWVVSAGTGERRFTVLEVSDSRANDLAYHGALRAQMFDEGGAAKLLNHLLQNVTVRADVIQRPLATVALRDQQISSLNAERRWLLDLLMDGSLPGDESGTGIAPADCLYPNYEAALKARGERRSSKEALGRFLKPYGIERARLRVGAGRVQAYAFPPLTTIRARFAQDLAVPPDWGPNMDWLSVEVCGGAFA